jgi:hypothetical protein
MVNMQTLLEKALDLPESERAELARKLLLSLEPADFDSDAEQLWADEIEARLKRLDSGQTEVDDWRPAVERMRRSLRRGSTP